MRDKEANNKYMENNKSLRETVVGYADEWVHEGVKLIKRLQLAVIIIAVAWMIFALGALFLLAYLVFR